MTANSSGGSSKSAAGRQEARLADYLGSARLLMAKYKTDLPHVRHVAELAERLFRMLQPLHLLGKDACLELQLAAYLHDIGHYVGENKHHLHSCYLILSDEELADWDAGVRSRVAYAALNHRKKRRLEWPGAGSGTGGETARLESVTALLRIADVLDHRHDQQAVVKELHIVQEERKVVLELDGVPLSVLSKKLTKKMMWAAAAWNVELILDNGKERIAILQDCGHRAT